MLKSGDFQYLLNSKGETKITRYIGSDTNITVPSTLNNGKVTVTEIDARAFCTGLTRFSSGQGSGNIQKILKIEPSQLTILGVKGSTAEKYAAKKGFRFSEEVE